MTQAGLLTTTNPMGGGNWKDAYAEQLKAAGIRFVVVFPDNDPTGERHEATVRDSCLKHGLFVVVVKLPGLGPKGDVSDYLDTHTVNDLFNTFGVYQDATGIHHPDPAVVTRFFPSKLDLVELQTGSVGVEEYQPDALKPKGDRPSVTLTGEQMADMASCWKALLDTNDPPVLFRFGEAFVRLAKDSGGNSGKNGNSGNSPTFRLVVLNADRLRLRLARIAVWLGAGKEPKPVYIPDRLLMALLASDEEAPLPTLSRMVTMPVFTFDGRLIDQPGYDPESRILYLPSPGFTLPTVPTIPTQQDVAIACDLILKHLMVDFPFVGTGDKAAAVATFLTPFARGLFRGPTPLFLFHKPEAGTGASLLMDMFTMILSGIISGHQYEPTTEDEWRKMITATLLESPPFIFIDNLKRGLNSSALAMALTSESWTDRKLGVSEMRTCPNEATWFATGNNPEITKENSRRVIPCRIDAKMEKPWTRTEADFKHPKLKEWVQEHRGELVHAALVLVQNWLAKGKPRGAFSLGSYERWAETMSGILEAAGIEGLGSNLKDFYATADLGSAKEKATIEAWWADFNTTPAHPKDLLPIADDIGLKITGETDRARTQSLGVLLKKWDQKTYDLADGTRVTVEVLPEDKKGSRYRLVPTIPTGSGADRVATVAIAATVATNQPRPTKCHKHPTTFNAKCQTCLSIYIDPDDAKNDLEP